MLTRDMLDYTAEHDSTERLVGRLERETTDAPAQHVVVRCGGERADADGHRGSMWLGSVRSGGVAWWCWDRTRAAVAGDSSVRRGTWCDGVVIRAAGRWCDFRWGCETAGVGLGGTGRAAPGVVVRVWWMGHQAPGARSLSLERTLLTSFWWGGADKGLAVLARPFVVSGETLPHAQAEQDQSRSRPRIVA